jgi:hypothetical protein
LEVTEPGESEGEMASARNRHFLEEIPIMNRRNLSKLFTLSVLAAFVAFGASVNALASLNFARTGLVGIVKGQTIRVTVAYVPEDAIVEFVPCVRIALFDERGELVKEFTERVAAGESLALEMAYSDNTGVRKVRAVVTLMDSWEAHDDCITTIEVLDTRTGETSFLLPAIQMVNPIPATGTPTKPW